MFQRVKLTHYLFIVMFSFNVIFINALPVIEYVCNDDAQYIASANYCVKAVSSNDFYSAEVTCLQLNGYLPSINNSDTNDYVIDYMKNLYTSENIWIGMDIRNEWLDGSKSIYRNFNVNDSLNTYNSSHGCISLNINNGYWSRTNCSKYLPFSCIFGPVYANTPPTTTSTSPATTVTLDRQCRENSNNNYLFSSSNKYADLTVLNCQVGNCYDWQVGGLILLNENNSVDEQISLFKKTMNAAVEDCHSGSTLFIVTPMIAMDNTYITPKAVTPNNKQFLFDSLLNSTNVIPRTNLSASAMTVLMLNHTATFLQQNSVSGDKGSIIYFMTDFGCDDLCRDELLSAQSALLEAIYETNTHIRLFYSGTNAKSEYECLKNIFSKCDSIHDPDKCNFGQLGPNSKNDVESACKPYNNPTLQILGIIVGILFFLAIIMGIIMRCYYKCTNGRHIFVDLFKLTPCYKKKKREGIIGSMALQNRNAISAENYYYEMQLGGRPSEWEIDPNNLLVVETKPLGSGAFAKVYEGILKGEIPLSKIVGHHLGIKMEGDGTYRVAVKKLPPYANSEAINDFRHEIAFMKQLGYHAHILSLLGCVTESTEPMILTEICPHGDVLSFVRSRKDNLIEEDSNYYFENGLKIKDLISIAWQTADGMIYLSTKNIVHRDIAARNVLLTESMVAKIADFGLCRLVDQALYTSKGGRLPIKWMALESLKYYEYTLQSDIWSLGVFLFELFSLGETPYATVQPADMPDYLESGKRLPKPEKCPEKIYQMMAECWKVESDARPKIEKIREDLSKLLTSATETYGYLDIEAQRQTSFVDEGEICGIPADIFGPAPSSPKPEDEEISSTHSRTNTREVEDISSHSRTKSQEAEDSPIRSGTRSSETQNCLERSGSNSKVNETPKSGDFEENNSIHSMEESEEAGNGPDFSRSNSKISDNNTQD